jgi:hypothetical protein
MKGLDICKPSLRFAATDRLSHVTCSETAVCDEHQIVRIPDVLGLT